MDKVTKEKIVNCLEANIKLGSESNGDRIEDLRSARLDSFSNRTISKITLVAAKEMKRDADRIINLFSNFNYELLLFEYTAGAENFRKKISPCQDGSQVIIILDGYFKYFHSLVKRAHQVGSLLIIHTSSDSFIISQILPNFRSPYSYRYADLILVELVNEAIILGEVLRPFPQFYSSLDELAALLTNQSQLRDRIKLTARKQSGQIKINEMVMMVGSCYRKTKMNYKKFLPKWELVKLLFWRYFKYLAILFHLPGKKK